MACDATALRRCGGAEALLYRKDPVKILTAVAALPSLYRKDPVKILTAVAALPSLVLPGFECSKPSRLTVSARVSQAGLNPPPPPSYRSPYRTPYRSLNTPPS
jgi:hypothetical protein